LVVGLVEGEGEEDALEAIENACNVERSDSRRMACRHQLQHREMSMHPTNDRGEDNAEGQEDDM
jgi:hypothetical protein